MSFEASASTLGSAFSDLGVLDCRPTLSPISPHQARLPRIVISLWLRWPIYLNRMVRFLDHRVQDASLRVVVLDHLEYPLGGGLFDHPDFAGGSSPIADEEPPLPNLYEILKLNSQALSE